MSLLDVVELQGIRGVGIGPQNANVIEFLSPLTIICGPNGAGKTTIIEALKYATTGELPKGNLQAFIHDLRLSDKARVDASVKLKFKDIRGRSCVVTRRMMQSKGAKGKVTNKSEESTIAVEKEPGDWKSLSSKVVDCKKEMLNLLGLPAAILEYVVFCHQEESSWPLDEPKKLKERFDEIFQVTGYVKAIEVLKKELKENQQELKVMETKLPLLIRQQEEKIELHNEYVTLKEEVAKNEEEIEWGQTALKDEIVKKDRKVAELEEAETLEKKRDMIKTERQVLVDQVNCCTAPDYDGGIDELKREIYLITHSEEFADAERDRTRIEKDIEKLNAKMKELVANKESINNAIVQCKSVLMMRGKMVEEREQCLKKCCAKFTLFGGQETSKQLYCLIEKCKEDIDNFKRKLEEKEADYQKEVDSIAENFAQISTRLEMKEKECKQLKDGIVKMEDDLVEVSNSSQKFDHLQNEIMVHEKMLEEMKNGDGAVDKIDDLRKERDAVAGKIEVLKNVYSAIENAEELQNKIKQKNEELVRFEKELDSLRNKHRSALLDIFGSEEPEFPLCERLSLHVRKMARILSAEEEDFKIHEKELSRAQHAVLQINREVDRITDQIATYKRKITKVFSHENEVETRLNEVKTLLKKSQQDLGLIDGCKFLYEQWEDELVMKKCCPLCERSYNSAQDCDVLVEKIKERRRDLPKEAEKLVRKVKEYEEMQNEYMEIVPYVGMLKDLSNEKEQLLQNLDKAEQKLRNLEEEFLKSKSKKDSTLEKEKIVRGVQIDASLMDNIWKSLSDAKDDINILKAEVVIDDCGKRSLSDIRAELSSSEAQYKDLIGKLDDAQAAASERNKLIERLNELKECRAALGQKVVQLDSLKKLACDKKRELESCEKDARILMDQKPVVEKELQAKRKERVEMQNEYKKEEAQLLRLLRDAEDSARELERLDKRLADIADGSSNLKTQEEDLSRSEAEIENANIKIRELTGQMDRLNSKQDRKRGLEDQLRKLELRERIKSLNERLKETEWHGSPISELKKELNAFIRKVNELQLIIENKKGELSERKKRLMAIKQNLNSPYYACFKEDLKKEVVKKCVTTKVIEDLATYIRVVDESVVKFHTQKMEEINEILAALWEQVYHGSDIETIRIKSESTDEKEKKKSYNYRVVMYVGGAEIDMPGRCSAGQKMLASILIRIALSDVFCDRCSIIALDEPTTNLDVWKVENLGDMLADIIKARCVNSTKAFQLIVITHDSRFVEHLRQLCHPEWIYTVSKDDMGLSRVKRHRNLEDAVMREG